MSFKKPYIWAFLFTLFVALWLGSGHLQRSLLAGRQNTSNQKLDKSANEDKNLFTVSTKIFSAEKYSPKIRVIARTESSETIQVRARTAGIIEELPVKLGDHIKEDDLLCRLDIGTRKSQLVQAKAALESARIDYHAASNLEKRKYGSLVNKADRKARLDAAKAEVKRIETDILYTKITAPVSGVVNSTPADIGNLVNAGDICTVISVPNPMLVIAEVSENNINMIKKGMMAIIELATGENITGEIRLISPSANVVTNTFRVEAQIANPKYKIRSGITGYITFLMPETISHKIPLSLLIRSDDGIIGVNTAQTVNVKDFNLKKEKMNNNVKIVSFKPVKILEYNSDTVWVSGLDKESEIITVGQQYVKGGQKVISVTAINDR